MKIFKLPDLGEGLPEATIQEWFVQVGDQVKADQRLVSVETAKALMDIPSPFEGTVEKLFGDVGDVITTGAGLIGFEGKEEPLTESIDNASVVGKIKTSEQVINTPQSPITDENNKATPAVRALARKLNVDLSDITPKGARITREEVEQYAQSKPSNPTQENIPLTPVRRAMVVSMTKSHQQVVPATIMDEADISNWRSNQKITLRLIQAIIHACQQEPMLNNSLDESGRSYRQHTTINLGIAVDTPEGLFVPVIKKVEQLTDEDILTHIEQFKQQAIAKTFPAETLKDATITLSNIGSIAGRFSAPIIVPPQSATIAAGRITRDDHQRHLPLSVTFDHRLITGGEAARFLQVLLQQLSSTTSSTTASCL